MALDTRRLYYYLVCLITLVMVIVGGVQVVNRTLDLIMPPEPYRPTPYEISERAQRGTEEVDPARREELEAQAERAAERQRRDMRRGALRGLIGSLALIGIAGPIYLYHWRKVRVMEDGPARSESVARREE